MRELVSLGAVERSEICFFITPASNLSTTTSADSLHHPVSAQVKNMKHLQPKIPRAVVVGLVLAIVLDTIIQITWKLALADLPMGSSAAVTAVGALSSPFFYVAMLALIAQLFNWTRVLARADLSFAQPFTALSYLSVLALSGRFLHESISISKACGVGLILLGVFFISRTPSSTRPELNCSQPEV